MINPHDKFFKATFSNLEVAKDFIANYLPEQILKIVDLETIQAEKDHYIQNDLKEAFSDLLYTATINGRKGYIYFLFEHKSYISHQTPLQLLSYMLKIWEDKTNNRKKCTLPLIIPMVIYHGFESWSAPLSLSEIIEGYELLPEEAKKYIPDYQYIINDLSLHSKEEIRGKVETQVILRILNSIFTEDVQRIHNTISEATEVFSQLEQEETKVGLYKIFVYYLLSVRQDISIEEVIEIAKKVAIERVNDIMTIAEQLRKEGMEQGIQQGMQQGMQKGAEEERRKVIKNMAAQGIKLEIIASTVGIDKEDIKKYLREAH